MVHCRRPAWGAALLVAGSLSRAFAWMEVVPPANYGNGSSVAVDAAGNVVAAGRSPASPGLAEAAPAKD